MITRQMNLMMCATIATVLAQTAPAVIHYVDKGNVGTAPYTNQLTAAGDIQTAIDYASVGSTVMVYAATYDIGASLVVSCSNRVNINKAISVRSVNNDRANTIIKGAWDPVTTNGPAAVRCVYMATGSSLIGFTITNGATATTGDYRSMCGGGIYTSIGSEAIISNCVITRCAAYGDVANGIGGGGVCHGTYYDCDLIGNRVGPGRSLGGGAFDATLYRCLLAGNVAEWGAGALRITLYDCIVSNNTAIKMTGTFAEAGGIGGWNEALPSRAYGCTIVGNSADRGGGAGAYTYLSNCIVKLNRCPVTPGQTAFAGGVTSSTLTDCQVISNSGGGLYRTFTTNCVISYNLGYAAYRTPSLVNCLIVGNGEGVTLDVTWLPEWIVESCTIVGNGYWGLWVANGNVYSRNNIIYGSEKPENWKRDAGTLTFENTCTTPAQAGWNASNLAVDPKLIDPGTGYKTSHVFGNYRLRGDSPCLNAGSNKSWMTGRWDLDGNPRLDKMSGIVDMGAYETVYAGTTIMIR